MRAQNPAEVSAQQSVLIFDEEPKVRARVRSAVEGGDQYRVVAEASDAAEALRLAKQEHPDLAVFDVAIPSGRGLAMLSEIKSAVPGIGVVVYSRFPGRQALALALGADAFVAHEASTTELRDGLREAAASARAPMPRTVATDLPWTQILDAVAEGVIVRDAQGVAVFANAEAERNFGVKSRDADNATLEEDTTLGFLRPDGSPMPLTELPGPVALATGTPIRDAVVGVISAQRGVRWISTSATPLFGADGVTLAGVVAAGIDITRRFDAERALGDSEERFRTAVDAIFAGLVIYTAKRNEHGEIVDLICEFANRAVIDNQGVAPAAQLGRGIVELFPDMVDLGLFQQYIDVVETGTPCVIDVPWYDSELVTGSFEISVAKFGDGCVMVFRDVTNLRRTEAALRAANEELSRFAAAAAHDLAEPLRATLGFAALLRQRAADQLDDASLAWVDNIVTSTNDMRIVIDDLLAYARAGSATLAIDAVDLAELAERARESLDAALSEVGATIKIGALPVVNGDSMKLLRVFQNLFSNAAKFASPGTPPTIVVDAERDGDYWRIHVTDDGIGIPDIERERVFEAFARLHARDEIPGSGLGLATCRAIVERHGGQIWVEPGPAAGSRLVFTLPA